MLKTEQLAQYLQQYEQLSFHKQPNLKIQTWSVANWQRQRLQQIHLNLFEQSQQQHIPQFFLDSLYDFDSLDTLAKQLQLALKQKIKLDRWLPAEIFDTLIQGFELSLLTLHLDQQIAQTLLAQNLDCQDTNIIQVFQHSDQHALRTEQLHRLEKFGLQLSKLAQSFLLRSTLRIAKPKIINRGFQALYLYIEQGLTALRSYKDSAQFFKQFKHQEQLVLDYLQHTPPQMLKIYYDPQHNTLLNCV